MRPLVVLFIVSWVAGCGSGSGDPSNGSASTETETAPVHGAQTTAEHAGTVAAPDTAHAATADVAHAGTDTAPAVQNTAAGTAVQNAAAGTAVQNAAAGTAVQNAAAQNAAPAAADETRVDAHGIVVTRRADGSIHVEGTDRWGAHMDITYADAHYYKHAVDVLRLSITPEQETALRASLPQIAPEALHDRAPPQPAGTRAGR